MSDELGFFDDPSPIESEAIETPQENITTEPAQTQGIDPAEVAALRDQVTALDRWKQEAGRFFAGQGAQAAPDPQAELLNMLQDPTKFRQELVSEAARVAQEQAEQAAVIAQTRAKYPELAPFEGAIAQEWESAGQALYAKTGKVPSFAETLEASISQFKTKLQGYQSVLSQQQTASNLQNQALNLSVGGQSPKPGEPTADQLRSMSSDDFARLRAMKLNGA